MKTAECCAFQQQFLDPPNSTVDWCKSMLIHAKKLFLTTYYYFVEELVE